MSKLVRRRLTDRDRLAWLRLIRTENVGPITFRQLIDRFGDAHNALEALPDLARRGGRRRDIRIPAQRLVEDEFAALHEAGGRLLAQVEPEYPAALAAIDDAPPLIMLRGDGAILERPMFAMVGARNASANGRRLARTLAAELGEAGYVVVSGMARGIDGTAHEAALDSGTLAVLAGGIDVIYPQENEALYHDIAAQGLLASEMPTGTVPQARHFPRRNRLISGLSLGVLVVEAALKSGSLITARFALEQGREVFAVPGSPLDPRAKGCNHLLRQGATLVERSQDIIDVLSDMTRSVISEPPSQEFSADSQSQPVETELDEARRAILELLGPSPVTVDELIRECQLSPAVVSAVLLELELAGRLERHPGHRVALLMAEPS